MTQKIVLIAAIPSGIVQALIMATGGHQGVHVVNRPMVGEVIGQSSESIEMPVGG
ncbi:hypothetical protein D3C78_1957830 [compost metagenome]